MIEELRRIVVGIDICENSDKVLKRALGLAKENRSDLFVVHAVRTPWLDVPSYFGSKEISVDKEGLKKKIEEKIKTLNKETNVSCFVFVKEGNADDVLLYESKLHKAELIIVGAHSKAKRKKNFLGTTAEKIANQSNLPVLVVKNAAKKPYKSIIAPTDFGMQSKQSILFAQKVFPASQISMVHSFETIYMEGPYAAVGYDLSQYNDVARSCAKKDMKDLMKELSIKKGKVIDGELYAKETLIEYIKKGGYDLVVIGSRGTAGFKALLGSFATNVLRETSSDVLVYVP